MNKKDVQLNIKVATPVDQSGGFLNKLFIALGLSLSTTVTDSLDFSNPFITVSLIIIMIVIAFISSKK
ncbi:hypothetical protein ISR92_01510 [Patescibacteria group bacterium]|nr:hypothetical protein [Patescibacteria group bacterium]